MRNWFRESIYGRTLSGLPLDRCGRAPRPFLRPAVNAAIAALSPAERAALIGDVPPIRRHFELGQPDCTGGPDCPVEGHAPRRSTPTAETPNG